MIQRMLLVILILLVLSSTAAQETNTITVAGVTGTSLTVYEFDLMTGEIIQQRDVATNSRFDDLSWSPDGLVLSYTQTVNSGLELVPRHETLTFAPLPLEPDYAAPYTVATNLSQGVQFNFDTTFDRQGKLLYGVRPLEDRIYEGDSMFGVVVDVYQTLFFDARSRKIGEVVHQYGCGHTASSPMAALLDAEIGYAEALLVDTLYGIAFGYNCFGNGLAISADGEFTMLYDGLRLLRASPDRTHVAGADGEQLVVVSLSDGSAMTYDIAGTRSDETLRQIAWDDTGETIYYVVQEESGSITITDEQREQVLAVTGFSESLLTRYTVSLYALDLASGDSTRIYATDSAYAIGHVESVPGGVVFSTIGNPNSAWIDYVIETGQMQSYDAAAYDLIPTELSYLTLPDSRVMPLVSNIRQATVAHMASDD